MSDQQPDDGLLRQVYDLTTQDETNEHYSRWATTYDDELTRLAREWIQANQSTATTKQSKP